MKAVTRDCFYSALILRARRCDRSTCRLDEHPTAQDKNMQNKGEQWSEGRLQLLPGVYLFFFLLRRFTCAYNVARGKRVTNIALYLHRQLNFSTRRL